MTAEPTGKALQAPADADAVLDFGQERRQDAMQAMGAVMTRVEVQRFSGQRLRADQVAVEFDDPIAAANHFEGELLLYLQNLGTELVLEPQGTADANVNPFANLAPWETILLHGSVPGNAMIPGKKGCGQIIEACAEIMRVLLAQAVVAASEDCDAGEGFVLRLKARPEFSGKINLETGKMTGIGRITCLVHTAREPRVSYLLGSAYGEPKGRAVTWEFPMVEQIYGPNRLRWRDMRAPDFEPGPDAPAKAVAS